MTCDRLLEPRRPAWDQPLAGDEPPKEQQQAEHREDNRRGLVQAALGREGPRLALREGAELAATKSSRPA